MLLLSQKGPRNFLLKYSDPTAQNNEKHQYMAHPKPQKCNPCSKG